MGAWGPREFDNDAANDWLDEIRDTDDLVDACRDALQGALDEDYLDADPASAAIAAAAVVAAIHDGNRGSVPDVVRITGFAVDSSMRRLALRAIAAASATDSELASLWEDTDDADWRATLQALVKRLQ
jgi:hypothetical protein